MQKGEMKSTIYYLVFHIELCVLAFLFCIFGYFKPENYIVVDYTTHSHIHAPAHTLTQILFSVDLISVSDFFDTEKIFHVSRLNTFSNYFLLIEKKMRKCFKLTSSDYFRKFSRIIYLN